MSSRFATRVRAFVLGLATLARFGSTAEPLPGAADYAAHEWGTFTSLQGSDGVPIPWNPLDGPSDLPSFVLNRQRPTLDGSVLCPKAGQFRQFGAKDSAHWLQRMETPVIYFHTEKTLSVDVHVRFPQGLLTEWFPQVSTFGPVFGIDDVLPETDSSHLRWNSVRVVPPDPAPSKAGSDAASNIPVDPRPSHYFAARSASAHVVESTRPFARESVPQRDRFLFYRGAGNFQAPLKVSVPPDDRSVALGNRGEEPIGPLFVVRVDAGKTSFATIPALAPSTETTVTLPEASDDTGSDRLGQVLRDALQEAGLERAEAQAMVDTWRDSWFEESGTRVLYLLPREWTDTVLPLELTPAPRRLVRVMVGRAEVLRRAQESRLADLVVEHVGGNSLWAVASLRSFGLGRFLEAGVTRGAKLARDTQLAQLLSCRVQPAESLVPVSVLPEAEWQSRIQELKKALRETSLAAR